MKERLQKILARAGISSRRKAEELILQGKIAVDGKVITELGYKADPAISTITCNGRPVAGEEKIYLLLNKPVGYVTTMSDPQGRPIVTDLLPDIPQRVFPVGRLDVDTEGALIMTNDGRLSHYIIHPSFEVNKTYMAIVDGQPSAADIRRLEEGILLDGRKTWPAGVRIIRTGGRTTTLEITIHEGKKRQVRRMFAEIGHRVQNLRRTAYGKLELGNLQPGKYRKLSEKDLKRIFSGRIPFTFNTIPD